MDTQIDAYKVFVRTDASGNIAEVNSSAFLSDTKAWTQIDQGIGDKYHHAQGNYFDKPIRDEYGVARYELIGGKVIGRTEKGMLADRPIIVKVPTLAERISIVEAELTAAKTRLAVAETGLVAAETRILAVESKTVADLK